MTRREGCASERGFTMIEALVALAIGGFVIATLATITGQWMRSWRHGFPILQRSEMLATSLDRIAADLAAARFVPANETGPSINFAGDSTSVTLVRRSLPVQARAGLEIVRLAPLTGSGDATLVRSRSPLPFGSFPTAPSDSAPIVLVRAPYAVRFSYADADQQWQPVWRARTRLPSLIRVEVLDRATGRPALAPLVVGLHVEAPMQCAFAVSAKTCDATMGLVPPPPPGGAPSVSAAGEL